MLLYKVLILALLAVLALAVISTYNRIYETTPIFSATFRQPIHRQNLHHNRHQDTTNRLRAMDIGVIGIRKKVVKTNILLMVAEEQEVEEEEEEMDTQVERQPEVHTLVEHTAVLHMLPRPKHENIIIIRWDYITFDQIYCFHIFMYFEQISITHTHLHRFNWYNMGLVRTMLDSNVLSVSKMIRLTLKLFVHAILPIKSIIFGCSSLFDLLVDLQYC